MPEGLEHAQLCAMAVKLHGAGGTRLGSPPHRRKAVEVHQRLRPRHDQLVVATLQGGVAGLCCRRAQCEAGGVAGAHRGKAGGVH